MIKFLKGVMMFVNKRATTLKEAVEVLEEIGQNLEILEEGIDRKINSSRGDIPLGSDKKYWSQLILLITNQIVSLGTLYNSLSGTTILRSNQSKIIGLVEKAVADLSETTEDIKTVLEKNATAITSIAGTKLLGAKVLRNLKRVRINLSVVKKMLI